jgi:hypothetical protein
LDPRFDISAQQIQLEVAAGPSISQITLWVDDAPFTTLASSPYQAWWTLSAGEHHFWVEGMNANGETVKSDVVTITVVSD